MNKEKTAMQMLYELIDSEVIRLSNVKGEYKKASEQCANQLVVLKMKAKNMQLLQKEQEQIEKAFGKGYKRGGSLLFVDGEPDEGNEYYQSKYGGEE